MEKFYSKSNDVKIGPFIVRNNPYDDSLFYAVYEYRAIINCGRN